MQSVVSESTQAAKYAVIWMHGLGAGYEDMAGLSQAMTWPNEHSRQIFLQAPVRPVTINAGMQMPAWYDIVGVNLSDREDYEGVKASSEAIEAAIEAQISHGILPENIFLVGFSQGGAMALFTALKQALPLGGVAVLSGYLPCRDKLSIQLNRQTPIFMGYGQQDMIVQPLWSQQTQQYLREQGFEQLVLKGYPMDHAVCPEEMVDLQHWFANQMKGEPS